jgi:hypothetical protein
MVHIRRTTRKSTRGCLIVGQLDPRGTPRQQEETIELQQLEPVEPQQKEGLAELHNKEDFIHS